jgi:integration host factor subunit beta
MKKKYTKRDIIKRASYKLHMTHNECKIIANCFFEILEKMITENKDNIHIEIRNFGIFNVAKTKERHNALNPKTKEKVVIPERRKVVFKPSKKIKQKLYNEYVE